MYRDGAGQPSTSREKRLEDKIIKLQRQLKLEKQRNRRKTATNQRVKESSKTIGASLKAVRKEREKDRELIKKLKDNRVLLESLNNQNIAPKSRKFSDSTRKFALSMFLCGPRVYRMVKSSKVLTLPSIRTLKRWTKSIKIGPGLNRTILKTVGAKVADFTRQERVVTLYIDGMKIKSSLTYSAKLDRFTGFPDDGINRKIEKNRVSRLATEAVTVMVTGVGRKFKQVIEKPVFLVNFLNNTFCRESAISWPITRLTVKNRLKLFPRQYDHFARSD